MLILGIVQGKAVVRNVDRKPELYSFDIEFPKSSVSGVKIGASVAINGTCLTVVEHNGDTLRFDVIEESLRRTNLGFLDVGSQVNFERSARVGDEIGGHTVSGHVHTTAKISKLTKTGDDVRMEFELDEVKWIKYILPKGFVSVDGCSLTVGEVTDDSFSVYLIPETLRYVILIFMTIFLNQFSSSFSLCLCVCLPAGISRGNGFYGHLVLLTKDTCTTLCSA